MKKLLLIPIFILLLCCTVVSAEMAPYAFPFIGRWQPAEDSLLIDDYGLQDIQNMRRKGKGLQGVLGHTKINTSIIDATYYHPSNGFYFKKDTPNPESHVLVSSSNATETASILYQNTTAIPNAGNFSTTAIHTDESGATQGRFSDAPQGQMIYSNGEASYIWGGDEIYPVAVITSTAATANTVTNGRDFSNQVRNSRDTDDQVLVIGGGNDAKTVLLIHAEADFTDSSTSNHTPNPVGNAAIDTNYAKFGAGSGIFDGTGDYVTYPDHANWFMGTDDFTIELWVRFNELPTPGTDQAFVSQYNDAANYCTFCIRNIEGSYTLRFFAQIGGGGTEIAVFGTWLGVVINEWYHVALIRGWGGIANNHVLTVNGKILDDAMVFANGWHDVNGLLNIGSLGATNYFNGWIDELRISKGVARWASNFTPPIWVYAVSSNFGLVGTSRPIQGLKFYVQDANTENSTLAFWEWNGHSWSSLTIVDNTDTGASLARTGTITFSSTVDTSEPRLIEGFLLYWYQYYLDFGTATIRTVTVDAPFQKVKDLWDSSPMPTIGFHVLDAGAWEDYTSEVNMESTLEYSSAPFSAELDDLANTEYIYMGFTEQIAGVRVGMTSHLNTAATTLVVYYWSGSAWVSVGNINDETAVGGISLARSGYITWSPPNKEEESPRNLFGLTSANPTPITTSFDDFSDYDRVFGKRSRNEKNKAKAYANYLETLPTDKPYTGFGHSYAYYYKFMWSVALSTDVLVDLVQAFPAPLTIGGYEFSESFQDRVFLFNEKKGERNRAIYSAYLAPDVWNGGDSGVLYFGGDTEITATAVILNSYRNMGTPQMIVTKSNSTHRVYGGGPESWTNQLISPNIGCIAPLSMVVCDLPPSSESEGIQVAIWQSAQGVVMSEGSTVRLISGDIENYWDPASSDYIPVAQQDDSVGFYDINNETYKLLICSNNGQYTNLNVELEYSLKYNQWTKIYRANASGANPLQIGFFVTDTIGNVYNYGGTDEGFIYRLENGGSWDSTGIAQYVVTKDLMLDEEIPSLRSTILKYFRLFYKDKTTSSTITFAHYGDQSSTATVDGVKNQQLPNTVNITAGPIYTTSCNIGPFKTHAIKISASTAVDTRGLELNGMSLYYQSLNTIQQ